MPQDQLFWVYILFCENNALYTGYTKDLAKRFKAHQDGTSKCKFTRSFKPLEIVLSLQVEGKANAMRIEREIKKLSRAEKEKLIKQPNLLEGTLV